MVKHKRIKNWARASKILVKSNNYKGLWYVERDYDKNSYSGIKISYAENDKEMYLLKAINSLRIAIEEGGIIG